MVSAANSVSGAGRLGLVRVWIRLQPFFLRSAQRVCGELLILGKSVIRHTQVGASACIREARLVVCPIGVYSTCPPPVAIERTSRTTFELPTGSCQGVA